MKAGEKPDKLPPDECLKKVSPVQCAVSASHHVQSINNTPQVTTVNQLRHKNTEITGTTNLMVEKGKSKADNKDLTNLRINSTAETRRNS